MSTFCGPASLWMDVQATATMAKTSICVMIECKSSLGIARLKNEFDSTDGNAAFSVNIHAGIRVLQGAIGTKIEYKKSVKHKTSSGTSVQTHELLALSNGPGHNTILAPLSAVPP
jgi:hypothetical protein